MARSGKTTGRPAGRPAPKPAGRPASQAARPTRRERQEAARREQLERQRRQAARRRRLRLWLPVAGVAVVVVAVAVVLGVTRSHHPARSGGSALPGLQTGPAPWSANTADLPARLRAIGLPPLNAMEGTAVHIHQHLDIYVDGKPVQVPALIGIDPSAGFAPLHVHDTTGVIHVESPTVRTYTLGQFFAVWGVRFTPTCLGGYCNGGGKELQVYVNGQRYQGDPAMLTLQPHQEIVVTFGAPAELPKPIPSTYTFPAGE